MSEVSFDAPDEEINLPLPKVTLWRILVQPYTTPEFTDGGIALAEQTIEDTKFVTIVGQVVGMGEKAYTSDKIKDANNPVMGSWVLFGKYAGQRFKTSDGRDLIIMNDNDVLGTVDNPADYHLLA